MKLYVILMLVCLGAACGNETAKEGAVLPGPQMTKVMWDIMQVDEYATTTLANDSGRDMKKTRVGLYQQVFDLHHITQKQFAASFKYYSSRPDLMKTVFDSLSTRGERERKNVYLHPDTTFVNTMRLDSTRADTSRADTSRAKLKRVKPKRAVPRRADNTRT